VVLRIERPSAGEMARCRGISKIAEQILCESIAARCGIDQRPKLFHELTILELVGSG